MNRFLLPSLFILLINPWIGYANDLPQKIKALIKQKFPNATVGLVIKDAKTNEILYSVNADKLMMPASGTKLFTAAAMLYQFGPKFQFNTTLSSKQSNYTLKFNGDPSLTDDKLNTLLKGIHHPIHNIIVDTSHFQEPNYSASTSFDDLGWYYAAPVTAAIINKNAVAYDFITGKQLGQRVLIKAKDPNKTIPIINQVITVNTDEAKHHCALNVDILPQNTLRLYGCLMQRDTPQTMSLAITDPIFWVKQRIKRFLLDHKLTQTGQIVQGKAPNDATTLSVVQSPHLSQLIRHMLKESDNVYANSFVKQLGQVVMHAGNNKQGMFALKTILSKHTHLDMHQLELADGAGNRYTLATPKQIVTLLSDIYQDETLKPIFFKALPIAGVDGSLRDRMKAPPLAHNLIAKTGSMHDVSSLSGYLMKTPEHVLIFSIIINGVNQPIQKAKHLEDDILKLVYDHC